MQAVSTPDAGTGSAARVDVLVAALLSGAVALHVAGMFFVYTSGATAVSQPDQAVTFSVLAAGWAAALGLWLAGSTRRLGAALAVGLGASELGLRAVDVGSVVHYGTSAGGAGLWLEAAGWLAGAVGAAVAVVSLMRARRNVAPAPVAADERSLAATVLLTIAGMAIAGAFLPAWDHYLVYLGSSSQPRVVNEGNALSGPWEIVAGNVAAAAAFVLVPLVASRLRSLALSAAAILGSLVVVSSQLASAVVQVDQKVTAAGLGLSRAQATQFGFVGATVRLTGWFTLEAIAALVLLVAAVLRATTRPVYESSSRSLPNAPEMRSDAMPSAS
jgi:hypothetical protein